VLNSVEAGRSAKDSPWDAAVERVDGAGAKKEERERRRHKNSKNSGEVRKRVK
jgi:hypothetical protein